MTKWKQLVWLITAFTLGHSLSLFLSGNGWIVINQEMIESLIGITILIAAIPNFLKSSTKENAEFLHYGMISFFGLIHGLGFSNFFKALNGPNDPIFIPLISFNIGVEIGQLCIVAVVFLISTILVKYLKLSHHIFRMIVSSIIIVLVLRMIMS